MGRSLPFIFLTDSSEFNYTAQEQSELSKTVKAELIDRALRQVGIVSSACPNDTLNSLLELVLSLLTETDEGIGGEELSRRRVTRYLLVLYSAECLRVLWNARPDSRRTSDFVTAVATVQLQMTANLATWDAAFADDYSQYVLRQNLARFAVAAEKRRLPKPTCWNTEQLRTGIEEFMSTRQEQIKANATAFLALMGRSEREVKAAIAGSQESVVLIDTQALGDSRALKYSGNPSLDAAEETIYTFWRDKLSTATVHFHAQNALATYHVLKEQFATHGRAVTDESNPPDLQCTIETSEVVLRIFYAPADRVPTVLGAIHKATVAAMQ